MPSPCEAKEEKAVQVKLQELRCRFLQKQSVLPDAGAGAAGAGIRTTPALEAFLSDRGKLGALVALRERLSIPAEEEAQVEPQDDGADSCGSLSGSGYSYSCSDGEEGLAAQDRTADAPVQGAGSVGAFKSRGDAIVRNGGSGDAPTRRIRGRGKAMYAAADEDATAAACHASVAAASREGRNLAPAPFDAEEQPSSSPVRRVTLRPRSRVRREDFVQAGADVQEDEGEENGKVGQKSCSPLAANRRRKRRRAHAHAEQNDGELEFVEPKPKKVLRVRRRRSGLPEQLEASPEPTKRWRRGGRNKDDKCPSASGDDGEVAALERAPTAADFAMDEELARGHGMRPKAAPKKKVSHMTDVATSSDEGEAGAPDRMLMKPTKRYRKQKKDKSDGRPERNNDLSLAEDVTTKRAVRDKLEVVDAKQKSKRSGKEKAEKSKGNKSEQSDKRDASAITRLERCSRSRSERCCCTRRPLPDVSPVCCRSPARRSPVRQSSHRCSPLRRSPARRSPVRRSPTRRSLARRSPARRSPARRSPARRSLVRRSPARRSPARRSPGKRSAGRRIMGRHSPARRSPFRRSPLRAMKRSPMRQNRQSPVRRRSPSRRRSPRLKADHSSLRRSPRRNNCRRSPGRVGRRSPPRRLPSGGRSRSRRSVQRGGRSCSRRCVPDARLPRMGRSGDRGRQSQSRRSSERKISPRKPSPQEGETHRQSRSTSKRDAAVGPRSCSRSKRPDETRHRTGSASKLSRPRSGSPQKFKSAEVVDTEPTAADAAVPLGVVPASSVADLASSVPDASDGRLQASSQKTVDAPATMAPPVQEPSAAEFKSGDRIVLCGLLKNGKLNGNYGTVVTSDPGAIGVVGAVKIRLDSGPEVAVKPQNIRRVDSQRDVASDANAIGGQVRDSHGEGGGLECAAEGLRSQKEETTAATDVAPSSVAP